MISPHCAFQLVNRFGDKAVDIADALSRKINGHMRAGSFAVRVTRLDAQVNDAWGNESNGDEVWAIVRDKVVKTIMYRRSSQPATAEALRVDAVVL